MNEHYYTEAFSIMRSKTPVVIARAGALLFDTITGVVDLATLQDLLRAATLRGDYSERAALDLLLATLYELKENRDAKLPDSSDPPPQAD